MKNFAIDVYAYHLRQTLTEFPDEVSADAHFLWENLVKLGETSLPFVGLKDLKSKLICYQNGVYTPEREQGRQTTWLTDVGVLDLGSLPTTDGFKINANLQPFLLNDTYAADLTILPESTNIDINILQLSHFKPVSLLPANIQASLGETLLVYGEVDPQENCNLLAEKLAVALVAGTNLNPVLINQDNLFDSLLYTYHAPEPSEPNNPVKKCEILIVLNNQQANTIQLAESAYDWLLNLFCCYHKIHYIYDQARQRYREARTIYSYLERKITEFNSLISTPKTELADLKKLLSEIPQKNLDYTRCLQDLQTHYTSITTNITNYEICLDNITNIGNGNSPKFWQDFLNKECKKLKQQIETDINYLTPGQELFGQLVDTIRGIVETQQAERDRSLERKIEILGIGFGGGAIVSGVVTQHIDKIKTLPVISFNKPPHPFYASLFLSFIATLFFIGLGFLFTKRK